MADSEATQPQTTPAQETTPEQTPQGDFAGAPEGRLRQKDVDKIVGREKAEAKEAAAAAKEREILEALGTSDLDAAKAAIAAHREREEANRSDLEKARDQLTRSEAKLQQLQGADKRVKELEGIVKGYADSLKEGLPDSIAEMLGGMDVAAQLGWLTKHRDEFVAREEPEPNTSGQRRRAPDTTLRTNPDENVRGRERLSLAFGQKYG
jgi:hypothetical protein